MMGMTNEQVLDFNKAVVEEFRTNAGKCGAMLEGNPLLLLTMTGAKSGRELISPLTFHANGDDFVIMASAGGDPNTRPGTTTSPPTPDVVVEVGTERFEATAVETEGDDRAAVYARDGGRSSPLRRLPGCRGSRDPGHQAGQEVSNLTLADR